MTIMERVTGIGGVFQRAGAGSEPPGLVRRASRHRHLRLGNEDFESTPGGSTTWAIFDGDTEYFGRPKQAFMVNFRVADLDAMLAQLRSAGVEVSDAPQESEYGRSDGRSIQKAPGSSSGNLRRGNDGRGYSPIALIRTRLRRRPSNSA